MPTKPIYIHGMGGSAEDWRKVQSRLSGISLTLNQGASSPDEAATDLASSVTALASGPFALCGYSMGGRISLLAAEKLFSQKRKPDALILVSAGLGSADEAERAQRIQRDEEWARLAETDVSQFWTRWYEQELFQSWRALPEATREAWLEQRKAMDIGTLTSQLRFLGPGRHEDLFPLFRNLASKGLRVLYLAGELDKKYLELSRKVGEIPGVSVEIIPGAGHVLPLEAPEALALRIARFIR